jgi:hypothetical protein
MRWIATVSLLALLFMPKQDTQAAEPKVITLTCDGTTATGTSDP